MASFIARRSFTTSLRRLSEEQSKKALRQEEKRNPEVYILGGVVACAIGGAAYYFGSSPTKSTSESQVAKAAGAPWETGSSGAYRYHPGGDPNADPKDAPSAVNVVVVPDVTLPKELHDRFNKWGKEGYP